MTSSTDYLFPQGFHWATATSSYQVEGHSTNNDWHLAAQVGGFIYQDQLAGDACNWWLDAESDFDRMVALNQNAHRLSIEWSRIEPEPGKYNAAAIDRYREMLFALKERGIQPMVTLHHFTNPIWLAERGGWVNDSVVGWFERYTRYVVESLGDITPIWCTINEPAVMISQRYGLGRWWPGKTDFNAGLHAAINVVRAHAAAYHVIHELVPNARVGIAKHMIAWAPYRSWMPNDHIVANYIDHIFNHMPLMMATKGIMRVPGRRSILMPEAAKTLDWLGVNYYQRYRVQLRLLAAAAERVRHRYKRGMQKGPGDWGEIFPGGLLLTLKNLWRRYKLPMMITENGIPDETDEHRPAFIINHLMQVHRAIQQGIPIEGYYFWSLVDNFEWSEGYDPRFSFGLIDVNFETQTRTLRQSAHLYGAICDAGGITREIVEQFTPQLVPQYFGS